MDDLLPDGTLVRFYHHRYYADIMLPTYIGRMTGDTPETKGGCTVAVVKTPDGRRFAGFALCSKSDNFCKNTGRCIALGRAIREYQEEEGDIEALGFASEIPPMPFATIGFLTITPGRDAR